MVKVGGSKKRKLSKRTYIERNFCGNTGDTFSFFGKYEQYAMCIIAGAET